MEAETKGEVKFVNYGQDTAENCPAVNAYTRYAPNGPKEKSETFDLDIDEYAPLVVNRIHSVLVKIGERTS